MPRRMIQRYIEEYRDHSDSYEDFEADGRPHVVCPQCRVPVLLCGSLTDAQRRRVAELRASNPVAAMELLRQMLPCSDREAKAIVLHLCRPEAGCHYCGHSMPRGALLCANCMSVNLDWA